MIAYFDTSALVACYVQGVSTKRALGLKIAAQATTSLLTYAEALGVFSVLVRTGALSQPAFTKVEGQFVADWTEVHRVKVESRLLPEVRRLIATHALKGADAIQLASACLVARSCTMGSAPFQFASDDRALSRAAEAEGLTLAW
jgi:uncharacterized protein